MARDGQGDVWRCGAYGHYTKAGRVPFADVRRFRARHGPANLRFRLWFTDLQRRRDAEYYMPIKTPTDLYYAYVYTYHHPRGYQSLLNIDGDDVRSKGMTHVIRYFRNTLTVVVPRALLGNPAWVRVAAVDEVWSRDGSFDNEDNPMDHSHHDLGVPLSIRVYRS